MKSPFKQLLKLTIVCVFFVFIGCNSVSPVYFKTPVDTKTKPIVNQIKQIYSLNELGVFVSNDFDGARLNDVKMINDTSVVLIVNPENTPINNSAYYAFKTWSITPKNLYFTFQYPKGYKHRYIPKLKINGNWELIDSTNVFKNDTIVTVKLNLTEKPLFVAAQELQTTADVKKWYTSITKGKEEFVKVTSAGKSVLGKNIPVLELSLGNDKNKDVIVLLTRQHPPEVTGYYAFQYFIETILDNSEISNNFLEKYKVLAFPVVNPDGVDLGHWRHNAHGVDTNRDWSIYNQPEIKNITKYISKSVKSGKSKIVLGLDFHSTYHDVFYTNKIRKGTPQPNFIDDWFNALEKNIPNYKVNEQSGNSNKPVSKGWFLYGHNAVGVTYEIGDTTPKKDIKIMGEVSATEMMKILLNE